MKLANTDLELDLVNRETAVFDLITNMQRARNEAQQNSIRQLNQLADVDNALAEAECVYKMNKKLFEEKVIAQQDFQSSLNMYNYQVRRKKLTEQTLRQDYLSADQTDAGVDQVDAGGPRTDEKESRRPDGESPRGRSVHFP